MAAREEHNAVACVGGGTLGGTGGGEPRRVSLVVVPSRLWCEPHQSHREGAASLLARLPAMCRRTEEDPTNPGFDMENTGLVT
jgi:hypothetical protein